MRSRKEIGIKSDIWLAAVLVLVAFDPSGGRADEPGRTWAAEASLPVSVNFWVDSRVALRDYHWAGDGAGSNYLSDVYARYAGVSFTARPNQYVEAHAVFLFEEFFADPGGDNFDMDQGWVKLSYNGWFVRAGKLFPPFAHESTFGIEDPLTWHLGDCRQSAIEAGFAHDYIVFSATAFNGGFDTVDDNGNPDDERIDDYVLHLHFHPLAGAEGYEFEIGGAYLSDIAETGLDFGNNFLAGNYTQPVPAASYYLFLMAPLGDEIFLGLDAEYIQSNQLLRQNYKDLDGDKTAITAANIELALFGKSGWIGAQYAMMGGFDWLGANARDPDLTPNHFETWGGYAGLTINDYASLAVQVMSGRDDEGDRLLESYFQLLVEI